MIVGEPKWMFSLRMDPSEYYTWGFGKLVVNSGIRIGPIRGLSVRQ